VPNRNDFIPGRSSIGNGWNGPYGAFIDFCFEIKAATQANAAAISSIDGNAIATNPNALSSLNVVSLSSTDGLAYTASFVPAATNYQTDSWFIFVADTDSTGSITIQFNDLPPVGYRGKFIAGEYYFCIFNGTEFIPGSSFNQSFATPLGTPLPYIGSMAPAGYVFLRGETLGNSVSGAVHADDDYEEAFNLLVPVSPNSGTEDWSVDETVVLPDMRGRVPLGLDDATVDRIDSPSAKLLGGNAGISEISILQANLPNINITTHLNGNHKHSQHGDNHSESPRAYSATQTGEWRVQGYSNSRDTGSSGSHTHTVPLGGSDTPIFTVPPFTAFNWIMRVK